ncbi:MAG: nucleoside transporter [Candidatus Omnitrophica bacterium]|nr:nucleoside transporter [Candidatus Omnitrophota bacterium]
MEWQNFISLGGMVALIFLAYACSQDRRHVNWHIVVWCIGFQLLIAWFLFVVPSGVRLFHLLNEGVILLIESSNAGARFLFGALAVPPGGSGPAGEESLGFIFAFQVFPSIVFFSSLMSILYFWRVLPFLIKLFSRLFTKLMNVSGAEALCAASNIFVGIESVTTVRPYLREMTRSELCVVLTAGMATVASNVLAVYVLSLREVFPNIAGHLISASLLSAPAAVMMAKLLYPEDGQPVTRGIDVDPHYDKDGSFFEAVINGAQAGVKLIVGICALLIAILGLVALTDQLLGVVGRQLLPGSSWSLAGICGVVFYPFTVLMGIPLDDAGVLSKVIGARLIVTELTAYQNLASVIKAGSVVHERSVVITTYALCGFAHVASLAIFIGGVSALVPEKTRDLSAVAARSLLAATLACLMTGCVAGLFFVGRGSVLFG